MGVVSDLGGFLKHRLHPKTIASEVLGTVIGRVSHGASELAHGLFTQGAAYVPYGQDTLPVSPPDEPVEPAQAEAVATPAMPSLEEQYRTQVALYAMRGQSVTHQGPSL